MTTLKIGKEEDWLYIQHPVSGDPVVTARLGLRQADEASCGLVIALRGSRLDFQKYVYAELVFMDQSALRCQFTLGWALITFPTEQLKNMSDVLLVDQSGARHRIEVLQQQQRRTVAPDAVDRERRLKLDAFVDKLTVKLNAARAVHAEAQQNLLGSLPEPAALRLARAQVRLDTIQEIAGLLSDCQPQPEQKPADELSYEERMRLHGLVDEFVKVFGDGRFDLTEQFTRQLVLAADPAASEEDVQACLKKVEQHWDDAYLVMRAAFTNPVVREMLLNQVIGTQLRYELGIRSLPDAEARAVLVRMLEASVGQARPRSVSDEFARLCGLDQLPAFDVTT